MLSLFCFPVQAVSYQPIKLSKGAVWVTEVLLEGKNFEEKPHDKHLQKVNALFVVDIDHVGIENLTSHGALPCLYLNAESSFDWQLLNSNNIWF